MPRFVFAGVVISVVMGGACTLTTSLDGLAGDPIELDAALAEREAAVIVDSSTGDDAPVSAYRTLIMSDGPVAYYRLGDTGESAKDETGAHPGTVIGTVGHGPGAIAGDSDGAFVGTGEGWIDIAQIYPLTGNAPYSIEAWVAPQSAPTLTGVLSRNIAMPGMTPSDGYSLYIDSPTLVPTLGRWRSSSEESAAAPALAAGVFTHVVGTYDGSTLRIYLNGALAASAPSMQSLIAPPTDLAIGSTRNGTYGYFIGSLDEVALYDKALSADRVAAHHAAGGGS